MLRDQYVFQNVYKWNRPRYFRFSGDVAIKLGYRFIIDNSYDKLKYSNEAIIVASKYGHLDLVKKYKSRKDYVNANAFEVAVEHGHLDVVEYLHKKKCNTKKIIKANPYFETISNASMYF